MYRILPTEKLISKYALDIQTCPQFHIFFQFLFLSILSIHLFQCFTVFCNIFIPREIYQKSIWFQEEHKCRRILESTEINWNTSTTAWKVSVFGIFLAFGLSMEKYYVSLCIQSECGKMWTRKAPNTDTVFFNHYFLTNKIIFLQNIEIGIKLPEDQYCCLWLCNHVWTKNSTYLFRKSDCHQSVCICHLNRCKCSPLNLQ